MAPFLAYMQSDVVTLGEDPEDGHPLEGICYYVICENERGARWRSRWSRTTGSRGMEAAERLAEEQVGRVHEALAKGASPANSSKWFPVQGAYGSAAWSELDEMALEARERESEGLPRGC